MAATWKIEIEVSDVCIGEGFRGFRLDELAEAIAPLIGPEVSFDDGVNFRVRIAKSPTQVQIDHIQNAYDEALAEWGSHYAGV